MKKHLLLLIAVSLISVAYPQRVFKRMTTTVTPAAKKHFLARKNLEKAAYGNFLKSYLKKHPGNKTAENLMERFNAGKNIGAVISKQLQSNFNPKDNQKKITGAIPPLSQGLGGAVVINGNSIETLDSKTNTLHGPFLPNYADDDDNVYVKVTPDGKMAFTLNFDYGQYISFIDISNPANPRLVGNFGFDYNYYIECFTISNDGKYLIVADDNGVENYIDVIDIKTNTDVKYLHLSSWSDWNIRPNAIAISPDDKTIIVSGVSDFIIGYSVLQFDSNSLSLSETQPLTMVEHLITGISFTPDGQTAIIDGFPVESVFTVTSPGQISGENFVTPGNPIFTISSVISNDGKKLYCYDYASGGIYIFNINGPGDITYSNNFIPRYLSDLFIPYAFIQDNVPGFPAQDILAIDGSGSILYANLMSGPPPTKPTVNSNKASKNKTINFFVPHGPDVILEIDLGANEVAGVINLATNNWDGMSIAASKNISFESITITSPAGGEDWQTGSAHNITWQSVNVNNVNIEVSTNNGGNWTTIATNVPAGTGSYNWIISPLPNSDECVIRISDASNSSVEDESNLFSIRTATFSNTLNGIVLLQPNGGEVWKGGTTQYIVFRKNTFFPSVKLEFSTDDGATWTQILSYPLSGLTYYPWTVPLVNSTKCRIRVSNWNNPMMNAVSAADFTITSSSSATNYPNPFNPSTTIRFNMLTGGHASVRIYNSLGQQVAELLNGNLASGVHEVRFDAANYPSGVYYYEVNTNGIRQVKKMLYIK